MRSAAQWSFAVRVPQFLQYWHAPFDVHQTQTLRRSSQLDPVVSSATTLPRRHRDPRCGAVRVLCGDANLSLFGYFAGQMILATCNLGPCVWSMASAALQILMAEEFTPSSG